MPDHTADACYLLKPDLQNPFTHQGQQPQQARRRGGGDNNDKPPPPPRRLTQRIKEAEALARGLMPQNILRCQKVRRVQGWHQARQTYFTLPLYGAAVERPVRHSQNPFHQPMPQVAYEAYDTSGDTVMCSCGQLEGFECSLEHWVRKAVDKDKPLTFSDRSEEGYMRIMQDGLVDDGDIGMIY
ncbi:hypothetical protein UCDDA912_g09189 [Diaporthe ampelina]|uniref:Uncharacterized protein n=1 Tax=Diaporthe ampelina TaxID=1214573 RepID=A0A0G2HRW6_9PEZI|nr:hypothetical protein UCDDA912_g09189 [Diaporthe ampelina]